MNIINSCRRPQDHSRPQLWQKKTQVTRLAIFLLIIVTVMVTVLYSSLRVNEIPIETRSDETFRQIIQKYDVEVISGNEVLSPFEGFDNEVGTDDGALIIPNIVHLLRFGIDYFTYLDLICLLSIIKNHRPEKFMFHTNVNEFVGPYWEKVKNKPGFVYELHNITLPDTIYGQKFNNEWHLWHASDVTRIRILMKHGGIFLDNDVYVVQNLDPFRKYEMVVGSENDYTMGTQVLLAHKNARFLKLWLECYKDYHSNEWYYNAGIKPVEYIKEQPKIVHWVKKKLGVHLDVIGQSFGEYWYDWRKQYTVHLSYRNRPLRDKYPSFDEHMIKDYNMTFGYMAREAYAILEDKYTD